MPRGVYDRRPLKDSRMDKIAGIRRAAVMERWKSVKEEQENWLKPFNDLPVEAAMRYLEDLRVIVERGGSIMNMRINDNQNIKCSGPRCGHDLTGTRPNGMPKWIAKMDFKDINFPEIFHSRYFCSELCKNEFTRKNMGSTVSDGR